MTNNRNMVIGIVVAVLAIVAIVLIVNSQSGINTSPTAQNNQSTQTTQNTREFIMTSYYDPAAQRPFFSLNEMTVNKGDRVRVKVTNTMGTHDFTIDEFGIARETPLNEEVIVEFTADKAGDFVYYCSKPGHRAAGQWGTLHVLEG